MIQDSQTLGQYFEEEEEEDNDEVDEKRQIETNDSA